MTWTKIKKLNFGCGCSRSFDERNICGLGWTKIFIDKKILDLIGSDFIKE
jgi:hypothetical protein